MIYKLCDVFDLSCAILSELHTAENKYVGITLILLFP